MPKTSPTPRLYVPMLSVVKKEVRAFVLDLIWEDTNPGRYFTSRNCPDTWYMELPPGATSLEDLPRFEDPDACYAYIRETWPYLQP